MYGFVRSTLFVSVFSLVSLASSLTVRSETAPPAVVPDLRLDAFMGKWHNLAAIPNIFERLCAKDTTAEYSLVPEEGLVRVLNSCALSSGRRVSQEGRARVDDPDLNSRLRVTFIKLFGQWRFLYEGYLWVLDIGDNYDWTIVGHPERKYAWIMSRDPALGLDKPFMNALANRLTEKGFDTCELETVPQTSGIQTKIPLCDYVQ